MATAAAARVRPWPLRQRAFGVLWGARTLSAFGDGFTMVALMIYATTVRATGVSMGILLVADIAPVFLSPLTGFVADRLDRGRVMLAAELAQGAVVAALA